MVALIFGLSGCERSLEPSQKDFDAISENVINVDTAESFEEMEKAVNNHNSIALSGNSADIINKRAKSSDSLEFNKLTVEQNRLAVLGEDWRRKNRDDMIYLQNFDWENPTSKEWAILISRIPKVCQQLEINNSYLEKIVQILDRKIMLAKIDSVIKELFLDDGIRFLKVLETMRTSQRNVLDQEKAGFKNLGCDDL
tara:strand:- start:84 stop:674 length:591 start_codon:yes stop_codon:yes gene_type:complete